MGPEVDPVEKIDVRDHALAPPEVSPTPDHDPKRQRAALTRAGDRVWRAASDRGRLVVIQPAPAMVLQGAPDGVPTVRRWGLCGERGTRAPAELRALPGGCLCSLRCSPGAPLGFGPACSAPSLARGPDVGLALGAQAGRRHGVELPSSRDPCSIRPAGDCPHVCPQPSWGH